MLKREKATGTDSFGNPSEAIAAILMADERGILEESARVKLQTKKVQGLRDCIRYLPKWHQHRPDIGPAQAT